MEVVKPTNLSFFTLNWLCFLLGTMVPGLKSQSPGGLVCISDCATCPIICSSPPPQLEVVSEPPPLPPLLAYGPPPPAPPLPPSSYISWGGATTPASPSNYLDSPPATETPAAGGGLGKINYSYPYFYYYASNAVSLTSLQIHRSTLLLFFIIISIFSQYS
ncbi:classical arabinogalactan protein 9-like [Ipomoea triloba]|uniref:classical arabinogalactan protein 9-like n=1 Tax=Ipomoea triloba TaxID=35885 RepID=UPI00125E6FD5|nr:classical arabinogalactan protein 9-like [Ipomoea triloba]